MRLISRDRSSHRPDPRPPPSVPDGLALFLGTMFAPIKDRDTPGLGFTHRLGDRVRIASERLGSLENRVTHCEDAPPWTLGIAALMRNLAARGLLRPE